MRVAPPVVVGEVIRRKLEQYARGRSTPARVVMRSRIVLLAADGLQNNQIAAQMGIAARTVALWRGRFVELGPSGLLKDAARPGRKPSILTGVVAKVIEKTTQSRPANATHWSRSTMAREVGVSDSTVGRILEGPRPQATPRRQLQDQQRPGIRQQAGSNRRTLSESTRARAGSFCRREEPDSSAGPHPARPADEKGARPDHDPRLQAQREPLRCLRRSIPPPEKSSAYASSGIVIRSG